MALAGSTTAGRGVETGVPPGISTAEGCSTADGRSTAEGLIELAGASGVLAVGGFAAGGATGSGARVTSVGPLAAGCAPEAEALLRPGRVCASGATAGAVAGRGITTEGWAT